MQKDKRLGWADVLGRASERGKILVVDDEQSIRQALRRIVTRFGYTVTTAGSSEEADQWLSSERFDVMLLDIELPRMKGVEFLSWALKRDREMAVIMMTGTYDYLTPPEATENTARQIKGGVYIEMTDIGHFPMSENYDVFRVYLKEALRIIRERTGD